MAPNLLGTSALFLTEASSAEPVQIISSPDIQHSRTHQTPIRRATKPSGSQYKWSIVWRNVIIFFALHIFLLYGFWIMFTRAKIMTTVFFFFYSILTGIGVTAGAHRLWAHRTYKAKLPLRIILMILQSAALQNHIYEWTRDHRVHHKFTDSDADPHNSRRGFFFSHMGWLMVKKHKEVFIKGKTVPMDDVEADPVVVFQRKYYIPLTLCFCFLLPTLFPWLVWNENLWVSLSVAGIARYTFSLNGTWLVNSAAHIFGTKPYDKTINPTENRFVAFVAFGEGWHNYHHVFPWDYKAAELGNYRLNITTAFLDIMAKIGWAYDLKTVSPEIVNRRARRTGDGTRPNSDEAVADHNGHHHGEMLWGWGDKDMKEDEMEVIKTFNNLTE